MGTQPPEALPVSCPWSPHSPRTPSQGEAHPLVQDSLGFTEVPLGWAVCIQGDSMLRCWL